VFRVLMDGPELDDPRSDACDVGAEWEGSRHTRDGRCRHAFLAEADDPDAAIAICQSGFDKRGSFTSVEAQEVVPPPDWQGLNSDGVDWSTVSARHEFTELERAALDAVLNAAEPTWMVMLRRE